GIVRTRTTADTQPGLSHFPHLILNQARVNGLLLEYMRRVNGQEVDYNYEVKSVHVDSETAEDPEAYPVRVVAENNGAQEVFEAKYVLVSIGTSFVLLSADGKQACDGAHSAVRRSLGYKMIGDSTDAVYGVMDVYPRTDFPDIRKKCTLQSDAGTILIIPREGGSLVRFYIELGHGTVAKDVKRDDLHEAARRIFHPYKLEVAETFWWSAYSIGQRLADHFSKDDRV